MKFGKSSPTVTIMSAMKLCGMDKEATQLHPPFTGTVHQGSPSPAEMNHIEEACIPAKTNDIHAMKKAVSNDMK